MSSQNRCYSSEVALTVSAGILLSDEDPFPGHGHRHSSFPGSTHAVLLSLVRVVWLRVPARAVACGVGKGLCTPGNRDEK